MALLERGLPPIGLEIGTNNFRVVQLKKAPQPQLTSFSRIKVPVGAVVEGEIVDSEAVSSSLAQLWKKASLKGRRVVVGVSNQKIVIRLIELPFMGKEELKNSIRYQVQEFIPIPVEETILDFQVMGEFKTESGDQMMEVLLVAAQKDMIENTATAVEKAGLKPEALDVSSFAIIRSLLFEPFLLPEEETEKEEEKEVVALVNIGSGVTDIAMAEGEIPRFVRVSPLAGNSFTKAVSEALSLSFDEAEDLKLKVGLPDGNRKIPGIRKNEFQKVEAAQKALEKESLKFATEVHRSFDYYLAQTPQVKKIDRIVLSGGGSKLNYLSTFLEKELQTRIELAQPLQKVKVGGGLSEEELNQEEASLVIPIGLALRGLA